VPGQIVLPETQVVSQGNGKQVHLINQSVRAVKPLTQVVRGTPRGNQSNVPGAKCKSLIFGPRELAHPLRRPSQQGGMARTSLGVRDPR
jgi:hypothetical protein